MFTNTSKTSETYLSQINNNHDEKGDSIIKIVEEGQLPKINGYTKILEIGVGGGSVIEQFRKNIKDPSLVVLAMDIFEPIARRVHNPNLNVHSVVADLNKLPFSDQSVSGINISSVLHEGISYNDRIKNGETSIHEYVDNVFKCLIKTLKVGGVLCYRDIGLPENHQEIKTINYNSHLNRFILNFTNYFDRIYTELTGEIPTDQWGANFELDKVSVSASIHYHRELQRHLITFLDLAMRQTMNCSLRDIIKQLELEERSLLDFEALIVELSANEDIFDSWAKREAEELYTYMSLNEIISLVTETASTSEYELEVKETLTTIRDDYTRLLQNLCDGAIDDTKQSLLIKRIS